MSKKVLYKSVSMFLVAIMLSNCAANPKRISGTYVSPLVYSNYSCDQIREEIIRVNHRVAEVSGVQRGKSTKDALALGIGLVLFWPALFFMMGGDKKEELARLKGEYEALEIVAIRKSCGFAEDLEVEKQAQEESTKKEEEKKEDPPATTNFN